MVLPVSRGVGFCFEMKKRKVEVEKEEEEEKRKKKTLRDRRDRSLSIDSAVFSSRTRSHRPLVYQTRSLSLRPRASSPFASVIREQAADEEWKQRERQEESRRRNKRRCPSSSSFFRSPSPSKIAHLPVPPSPTSTSLKEGTPSGVTWPGRACGILRGREVIGAKEREGRW